MPIPTDEALVYAIALGESFTVHEPLPGRAKKKTFKELIVPSLFKHDYTLRQHSRPLAHFIASHFFERTVMVLAGR